MENPTIIGFMIGIVFISMFAGIFITFIGGVAPQYGLNDSISEIGLEDYYKLEEMEIEKNRTLSEAQSITGGSGGESIGIFDIAGNLIQSGFSVLKNSVTSINIFENMVNEASEKFDLPGINIITRSIIVAFGLLIAGIFIAVIMKLKSGIP